MAALAPAAVTEWRTEVQVSNGGDGFPLNFAFDGGLNDPSSSVSLAGGGASGQASAALNENGYVPTLRTIAGNDGRRAQAVAWGVQGFTNTSGTILNTTLNLNLTGSVTGGNDLRASVYLFQTANFEYYQDRGTILFESSSQLWPGFESLANNLGPEGFDVSYFNHTGDVAAQRSFDFSVPPGEDFYVWVNLVSTAKNIGVSDASSTLTASLSNTNGLVPAAAVPEPGALTLFLAAGALSFLRRRRMSH